MTYDELITWQYAHAVDDDWFVAVGGHTSPNTKPLLEIKALKDNAPDLEIHVLHVLHAEQPYPKWIVFESREEVAQKSLPRGAAFYEGYNKFNATMEQMQNLAQQGIRELGYTVTNVGHGFVSFETGMTWGSWSGATGSISLVEHEPFWFTAHGTGKQNVRGLQLVALDFGEASGKAAKVIRLMKELASD